MKEYTVTLGSWTNGQGWQPVIASDRVIYSSSAASALDEYLTLSGHAPTGTGEESVATATCGSESEEIWW